MNSAAIQLKTELARPEERTGCGLGGRPGRAADKGSPDSAGVPQAGQAGEPDGISTAQLGQFMKEFCRQLARMLAESVPERKTDSE
jgi:hypothetical protein